jgi:TP901 family phage tail tape measure protein
MPDATAGLQLVPKGHTRVRAALNDIATSTERIWKLQEQTNKSLQAMAQSLSRTRTATKKVAEETDRANKVWKYMKTHPIRMTHSLTRMVGIFNTWNKGLIFASRLLGKMFEPIKDILTTGGGFQQLQVEIEEMLNAVEGRSAEAAQKIESVMAAVREQGAQTEFTFRQVAEGTAQYIQMGISAEKVAKTLANVTDFATSRQITYKDAILLTTRTLRQFGLDTENTAEFQKNLVRVTDILNKTHLTTGASVQKLGQSLKFAGTIAKAAGFELQDVAAHLGILANAGLEAGQGGRNLRTIYARLSSSLPNVKKGIEELNAATKAGISLTERIQTQSGRYIEVQRTGKAVLEDIVSAYGSLGDAQKNRIAYLISGQRAMTGMIALTNAGIDGIRETTDVINDSAGITQKLAERMRATFLKTVDLVKSGAEAIKIALFTFLGEPATQIASTFAGLLRAIATGFRQMREASRGGLSEETLAEGFDNILKLARPWSRELIRLIKETWDKIKMVIDAGWTAIFGSSAVEGVFGERGAFLGFFKGKFNTTFTNVLVDVFKTAFTAAAIAGLDIAGNLLFAGIPALLKTTAREQGRTTSAKIQGAGLFTPGTFETTSDLTTVAPYGRGGFQGRADIAREQERRANITEYARGLSDEVLLAMLSGGRGIEGNPFQEALPESSRRIIVAEFNSIARNIRRETEKALVGPGGVVGGTTGGATITPAILPFGQHGDLTGFSPAARAQREITEELEKQRVLQMGEATAAIETHEKTLKYLTDVQKVGVAMRDVRDATFELATIDLKSEMKIEELGLALNKWLLQPINVYKQQISEIKGETSRAVADIRTQIIGVQEEFLGLSGAEGGQRRQRILKGRLASLGEQFGLTQTAEGRAGIAGQQAQVLQQLAQMTQGSEQTRFAQRQIRALDKQTDQLRLDGEINLKSVALQQESDKERAQNLKQQLKHAESASEQTPILAELLEITKQSGDEGRIEAIALNKQLGQATIDTAKEQTLIQREQLDILKVIAENTRRQAELTGLTQYKNQAEIERDLTGKGRPSRPGFSFSIDEARKTPSKYFQGYNDDNLPIFGNVRFDPISEDESGIRAAPGGYVVKYGR